MFTWILSYEWLCRLLRLGLRDANRYGWANGWIFYGYVGVRMDGAELERLRGLFVNGFVYGYVDGCLGGCETMMMYVDCHVWFAVRTVMWMVVWSVVYKGSVDVCSWLLWFVGYCYYRYYVGCYLDYTVIWMTYSWLDAGKWRGIIFLGSGWLGKWSTGRLPVHMMVLMVVWIIVLLWWLWANVPTVYSCSVCRVLISLDVCVNICVGKILLISLKKLALCTISIHYGVVIFKTADC
jgi:hypothetical protein